MYTHVELPAKLELPLTGPVTEYATWTLLS